MAIQSVEWKRYTTPLYEPFRVNYGVHLESEHILLKLTDTNGLTGFGDCTPLWFFTGETCDSAESLLKMLAKNLKGIDVFDSRALSRLLNSIHGNPSFKSCLEMAFLDLRAKTLNTQLCTLLGGKFRESVRVSSGIGMMQEKQAVSAAMKLVESGIRTFKIKVGESTDREAEKVKSVRRAVGDDVTIRIDANAAYNPRQAIRLGRAVSSFAIEYFEQPVKGHDLEGLKEVKKGIDFDVMADESVHSSQDAMRVINFDAADLIGIKLAKCGGIREAKRIIEITSAVDMPCVIISAFETWVGISANLHLAASSENCTYANDLALWTIQKDDLTVGPKHDGDKLFLDSSAGLGASADILFSR
ncbi:MAG: dipeptide epimerase [Conexivisphaerales archaeon]